jgi:phosphoribosylformylglycinamidine cyclo-ligase
MNPLLLNLMAKLNYAQAGVNRKAADRFVEKIAGMSQSTHNRRVKAAVGGYASLYELDKKRWIAASTDGVGTKLKLAFQLKEHRTVGIDLVAMSVNDLLCVGALPLFFLDYFATGKLEQKIAQDVLQGITEGCKQARCALVGGETAEMPDFYTQGEYDLAGFAVGMVEAKQVLPQKEVRPGDVLIGLASSGCHSNGYSLLRKLLEKLGNSKAVARELLTPTRIYVSSIQPLLESQLVKGLAHITGSGFLNVPRISEKVSYEIHLPTEGIAPIFKWVESHSEMNLEELTQTFNMGIGMVLVVSPQNAAKVMKSLKKSGETAWEIGKVRPKRSAKSSDGGSQITLHKDGNSVTLSY